MVRNLNCSRCGGMMQTGFIRDTSQNATVQSYWVEGEPQNTRFLGMDMGTLSLKNRTQLAVVTYRCTVCGYLESYAPDPAAPENTLLRAAQGSTETDSDVLVRPSEQEREEP